MIIASVCARKGSKGTPDKNIRYLGDRTLIEIAIADALGCGLFDKVVFSSDSEEFIKIAQKNEPIFCIKRPPELATDSSSKWNVFRHLIVECEKKTKETIDLLVDLDAGTPFRSMKDVSDCVGLLRSDSRIDCVTTAYEADRSPYFNMVKVDADGWASIVIDAEEPVVTRQSARKVYNLTPVCFVMRRHAIFNYDHWSTTNFRICEVDRKTALDIDDEYDYLTAKLLWDSDDVRN